MYPKILTSVRDYLLSKKTEIIGSSDYNDTFKIVLDMFNEDSGSPAVMIREYGGSGDRDIPSMTYSNIQVWCRASTPEQAYLLMRKVDNQLHRFGPALMSDDLYVWHIGRNVNAQRLDDIDSKYCQYFTIYTLTCRETISGV